MPIIEDDADGMLPPAVPSPTAELTGLVTRLSKWPGAGLRTAYLVSPMNAA